MLRSCLLWLNLFADLLRFLILTLRSKSSLAAENLFLRKQLALYQDRKNQTPTDLPSNPLGSPVAQPLVQLAKRIDIFAGYWRAAKMSGDRARILACGGVAEAIRAQLKISVGSNQMNDIQPEDLVEQAFKLSQGFNRIQTMLVRWQSPVPPLIQRFEAMIAWAGISSRQER